MEMLSEAKRILRNAPVQSQPCRYDDLDDENSYFAKFICSKMSKYSQHSRNAVQHAIPVTDIIFRADQGYYDYNEYHQCQYGGYNAFQMQATAMAASASSPSYTSTSQPSPADSQSQQSINIEDLI